ncbi:MAG: ABC transporter substrate-binding protein [Bacteroidetes bacterium]|nr:ABC transporter substrate-binding protein [Bacteroidota bacterium]
MNGLTSLDPAAAANFENIQPVNQLYNGLLQMDDDLNVIPCIARHYSISEDGLTYTFRLRQDVFFHDNICFKNGKGRKVTAQDFVFSFHRLYDSKVSSAISLLENIKNFEATNDSTLKISLKKPFSAFLSVLTMKYFSVVPREAVEYYKLDFRANPVGTGAFVFKAWEEGTKLILLKNEHYFERDEHNNSLPYLDAVTVSFIKDRETAFMELLNGKFDMLSGADAFNANEVLDREGNLHEVYAKKFYLQKETFLKTDYIGILVDTNVALVKNSPLKLKLIRQAINYAFDRNKLVKYLRNNLGEAAHAGFIPKGMKSYNPDSVKGYYYNPEKVKQLLAEAGFANGKGLPELTIYITDNYKEQAEFIQSQLAANNIKTHISVEKTSVLRQAVNNCEYLLFKKSWYCDYADEENFMSLFYGKNFTPQGVNFFHYKNAEFDTLYETALAEKDEAKKILLYQKMDKLITEDAPFIPLYYDQVVRLVSHNISGLETNAMNLLNLKTVKKLTTEAQRTQGK